MDLFKFTAKSGEEMVFGSENEYISFMNGYHLREREGTEPPSDVETNKTYRSKVTCSNCVVEVTITGLTFEEILNLKNGE